MTALATTPTNILFVDDEPFILRSLQRLFSSIYNVFTASSGLEAIDIVSKNQIHVVVCDQRMPEMIGVEALAVIKEISPATMRILLTGYSDMSALVDSINDGEIFRYILKPWNNKELKEIVGYAADIARESLVEGTHFVAERAADPNSVRSDLPSTALVSAIESAVDLLVVDDDKATFELISKAYDSPGRVHYANTIDKAFTLLEDNPAIGILITDVKANREPVAEMVAALKYHYPYIVTIALTSLGDSELLRQLINQCQIFRFMIKPPSRPVLMGSIQKALDKHNTLKSSASEAKRYQVDVSGLDTDGAMFKRMGGLGARLKAKVRALFGWLVR
ncbi:MAG: response regulator [Candidatus Competibacter denitrificans]